MTETIPAKPNILEVQKLPAVAFDTHSILWWANALMLGIETAMFGILVTIYFSVMMNTSPFPPPQTERFPVLYNSAPDMTLPVIGLFVLLISLGPDIWLDVAARRRRPFQIKIALIATLLINFVAVGIRYYEFDSLHFKWDDNAYGSITWMLLGMHLLHMIVLACEDIFLLIWTFVKGVDDKHAVDLTVTAVYWYWIVAVWILLFPLLYIVPRYTQ